jgi:hypothetical protein
VYDSTYYVRRAGGHALVEGWLSDAAAAGVRPEMCATDQAHMRYASLALLLVSGAPFVLEPLLAAVAALLVRDDASYDMCVHAAVTALLAQACVVVVRHAYPAAAPLMLVCVLSVYCALDLGVRMLQHSVSGRAARHAVCMCAAATLILLRAPLMHVATLAAAYVQPSPPELMSGLWLGSVSTLCVLSLTHALEL